MDDDVLDDELTLEYLDAKVRQLTANVRTNSLTVRALGQGRRQAAPKYTSGELLFWVDWFIGRYELGTTIPRCWPQHGALVEELAALYVGWVDAIGHAGRSAIQWHDDLGRALDRITNLWRTSCQDGTHRPTEPASWMMVGPDGADRLDVHGARPLPPPRP